MFILKKKRKICMIMIVLMAFSFNLAAYSTNYEKGLNYLRKVKKNSSQRISEWQERNYLEKAYRAFKQSDQKNARLFQVYIGQLISKHNEIRPAAAQFVKEYRTGYITMIADLELLNREEKKELKNYMLEIEENIPFIERMKPEKNSIFPFQGEGPGIRFILNTDANVKLNIDEIQESKGQLLKGENKLNFNWKNDYMDKPILQVELNAVNDYTSYSTVRKLYFQIQMPTALVYHRGEFKLKEYPFLEETKIVKKRDPKNLSGGFFTSLVYGLYGFLIAEETGGNGLKTGLTVFGVCLGIAVIRYLIVLKDVTVPHKKNIRYNQELKKQIEDIKKQIKVNLQLKSEQQN